MSMGYGHRSNPDHRTRPLAPIYGERVLVRVLNPSRGRVNAFVRDVVVPVTIPLIQFGRDRVPIEWMVLL